MSTIKLYKDKSDNMMLFALRNSELPPMPRKMVHFLAMVRVHRHEDASQDLSPSSLYHTKRSRDHGGRTIAVELAEEAMAANEWNQAIQLLSQAIRKDSKDHALFGKRAKVLLKLAEQQPLLATAAFQDAQRSCMLEPSHVEGYLLCSKAGVIRDDLWTSEIIVRKGLLCEPEHEELLEQLERIQNLRNNPSTREPRFSICPLYDPPINMALYTRMDSFGWDFRSC